MLSHQPAFRLWQGLGGIALLALGLLISAPVVLWLIDLQAQSCPVDAFLRGPLRGTAPVTYLPAVAVSYVLAAIVLGETLRRLRWVGARRVGATNLPIHPIWLAAALVVAAPLTASFALAGVCAGPDGITARSTSFSSPQAYRWPDVRRVAVACWEPVRGGTLIDVTLTMPDASPVLLAIRGGDDLPQIVQGLRQALGGAVGDIAASCSPATQALLAEATAAP